MRHAQTSQWRPRLKLSFLAATLCLSLLIPALNVFAAIDSVRSPDGSITYSDGGASYVNSDTAVLAAHSSGDAYYSFGPDQWVDVYYDGAPGQPNGAYFPGNKDLAVSSGFVSSTGAPSATNGGSALGAGSLINVPFPGVAGKTTLLISAYGDGLENTYAHTFISLYSLSLKRGNEEIRASFSNNGPDAVAATVILAAYDGKGRLMSVSASDALEAVAAGGSVLLNAKKLDGAAYYRAFAWDSTNFAPLLPPETINE